MRQDRVLVALDVPDVPSAVSLAGRLHGHCGGFKVGMELFYAGGPALLEQLPPATLFLDLKLHDIPNTVAGAARVVAKLGPQIFNVHCLGGSDMMRAAVEAAREVNAGVRVIGVTVLTSHDEASLRQLGLEGNPAEVVRRLAELAHASGLDGVVCSPREAEMLRSAHGPNFLLVTPGVRPPNAAVGDQKRVMTPAEALAAGADWLVVGRPVTAATDPVAAADSLFF